MLDKKFNCSLDLLTCHFGLHPFGWRDSVAFIYVANSHKAGFFQPFGIFYRSSYNQRRHALPLGMLEYRIRHFARERLSIDLAFSRNHEVSSSQMRIHLQRIQHHLRSRQQFRPKERHERAS